MTVSLAAIIFGAGVLAGGLGIVLGLGGGIFLVPFLTLVLGFPVKSAAAISLATVIATSSAAAAAHAGSHQMNLRLGMLLEVATAAGSLLGGHHGPGRRRVDTAAHLRRGRDSCRRRDAGAREPPQRH